MFKISKGYNVVPKTFRLPEPIIKELEKLAFENNISMNQLVVQCIKYALENMEKNT